MQRLFTKDTSGISPQGFWFAGDVNALQDAVAAIYDLAQQVGVSSLVIGESGLQLVRFGSGEARITGALRTDGILRGLGGLVAGSYTTTARNAISLPPTTLIIYNTTTAQLEWNVGTPSVPNWQPLITTPTQTGLDGWISQSGSFTYSSVDGHTSVMTYTGDLSTSLSVGMRVKLLNASTTKYFIVTGFSFSGGTSTVTLYGGINYVLANSAITQVSFSTSKAPVGFPMSPSDWQEKIQMTGTASLTNPTANTWYNLGSNNATVPIGAWDLEYYATVGLDVVSSPTMVYATLSKTAGTQDDSDLTAVAESSQTGNRAEVFTMTKRKFVKLATKTTYYLNLMVPTPSSDDTVRSRASDQPHLVTATCAYL